MISVRTVITATGAVIAAFLISCLYLEQNQIVHAYVGCFVRSILERSFNSPLSLQCNKMRFLTGIATVHQVVIQDPQSKWKLYIGTLELHFSWTKLLKERTLSITCVLKDVIASSAIDNNNVALLPIIMRLLSATTENNGLVIERLLILNGKLTIEHHPHQFFTHLAADIPVSDPTGLIRIWLQEGTLIAQTKMILADLSGHYEYYKKEKKAVSDFAFDLLNTSHQDQRIVLSLENQNGIWTIQGGTPTRSMRFEGTCDRIADTCTAQLATNASYLSQYLDPSYHFLSKGEIQLSAQTTWSQLLSQAQVDFTIEQPCLKGIQLTSLVGTVGRSDNHYSVTTTAQHATYGSAECMIASDGTTHQLQATHHGAFPTICGLTIAPTSGIHCVATIRNHSTLDGSYRITLLNNQGLPSYATGSIQGTFMQCVMQGAYHEYQATCALENGAPHSISIKKNDEELLHLTRLNVTDFEGMMDYALIMQLAKAFGTPISGEGKLLLKGSHAHNLLSCSILLQQAAIRLPQTYSMLEKGSVRLTIDLNNNTLTAEDLILQLHKGTIYSSCSTCLFANNQLEYIHAPLCFANCFVQAGKEIFATLSGAAIITYNKNKPLLCQASLFLDRTHMRCNIFSSEFQSLIKKSSSRPSSVHNSCDITLCTRSPFNVQTTFLQATARARMHIAGTTQAPHIQCTIEGIRGTLLFPHKPLFIQRGTITFSPEQGEEALISLHAANTIKGYTIQMHVEGTARVPHISFESTPHLPEEQIIGLLWGGSEDGSLYLAMSASIMQLLEQLVVGSGDNSNHSLQSLKNIFKPLGSVRFIPGITDQSGRGGLRGSLAIEVNDRLRGIIKQNFDLPQDVMLEVEYALSDEARIRGFRDERGDLGGELEASWKF